MNKRISKTVLCCAAVFGLTIFAACGDSNTTEVTEQTGMDILAKGEKLPDCTKDNAGVMLYVTDSAAVYYCADSKWATLNGKDGETGTATNGTNGKSCSATQDEKTKNVVITCETDDGKEVSYTIENGTDGKSCSATQNDAKTETTITCQVEDNKSVSYVVKNGENCTTETNEDGSYTIKCAGSADVTIQNGTDGKSACDLALGKECTAEDQAMWLASISQGVLKDSRDGQIYKTVTIGTQTWMAENLNYSVANSWCYNEGADGVTEEVYKKNCVTYGRLYTWAAANSACPSGWHLPSNDEWKTLFKAVDAESSVSSNTEGTKLKSASGWNSNGNGKDSFGFAVLPAGIRLSGGGFYDVGNYTNFWNSTEYSSTLAWSRSFYYKNDYASYGNFSKNNGYSVRCLRD